MGVLLKFASAFIVFLTVVFSLAFGLLVTTIGIGIKEITYTIEPYVNQQEYVYSPTILITVGVVMLLISFTGGCALITKKFYVSLLFTTFLTLLLFSEISLSLTAYIMRGEIKEFFLHWSSSISMYHLSADMHLIWDVVQNNFRCCGVRNSSDWKSVEDIMPIPKSCYYYFDSKVYESGCVESVANFIEEHSNYIAIFGVILMMEQLIGVISSCSLTRIYRKR